MYASILIYLFHPFYWQMCVAMGESTTIRVSRRTAEILERLREKLGAESLDEAIQSLVREQRRALLEKSFGADRDRIKPFTEADRGEDRS